MDDNFIYLGDAIVAKSSIKMIKEWNRCTKFYFTDGDDYSDNTPIKEVQEQFQEKWITVEKESNSDSI